MFEERKGIMIMDIPFELILAEECKPFLKEFKRVFNNGTKLPLRRGMVFQPTEIITKIKTPVNRTPKNMNLRMHSAIDQWFLEKFGIKYRSNAVFCTASKKMSRDYGYPFLVFPKGKFQLVWSRKVDDLYFHLTEKKVILHGLGDDVSNSDAKNLIDDINYISDAAIKKGVYTLLESYDYVSGELDQALASKNEIMIACDYYYVAKDDDPAILDFIKELITGDVEL